MAPGVARQFRRDRDRETTLLPMLTARTGPRARFVVVSSVEPARSARSSSPTIEAAAQVPPESRQITGVDKPG